MDAVVLPFVSEAIMVSLRCPSCRKISDDIDVYKRQVYTLKDISLTFGVRPLFTSVSLNICRGDKICLVGRNGSGKSTLLKIISGVMEPDGGEVFVQPGLKIAYMEQAADFSKYETLQDVILSGLDAETKELSLIHILVKEEEAAAPAEPATKICPYCCSEISAQACRCPHCTSELK